MFARSRISLWMAIVMLVGSVLVLQVPMMTQAAIIDEAKLNNKAETTQARLSPRTDPVNCPATFSFGVTFACSLNAAGEVDKYPFDATINDQLVVHVLKTSGAFSPYVSINDPNGNVVCSGVGSSLVTFNCSIKTSGTFVLQIEDNNAKSTGGYEGYVQRLNGVGNASHIDFGQIYTGTLSTPIEMGAYTFDATINDQVSLRVVKTSGSFSPYFGVYDKDGKSVCTAAGGTLAAFDCAINATGTYSILVGDNNVSSTGDYQLFMQRPRNPGNAQPIDFGKVYQGSIDTGIEADAYTFSADINDQILFRVHKDAGNMTIYIGIYDKDGKRVCYATGATLAIIEPCAITTAGQYTILIEDNNLSSTGKYTLQTQRINNPGNATPINFGQTINDSIDIVAGVDTYTFNALSANKFNLTMTRTSGSFSPDLRVYDNGGKLICSNAGASTALIQNCTIPSDGQFTVLADDYNLSGVGNYSLKLACLSTQCGSQPPVHTIDLPLMVR